jgi:hypothetical protein
MKLDGMDWINVASGEKSWRAFLSTVVKTWVVCKKRIPCVEEEFLACQGGLCCMEPFACHCCRQLSGVADHFSTAVI